MNEWIKFEDDLPQHGEYVLTFGDNDIFISRFEQFTDGRHKRRDGYFVTDEGYGNDITHWMPLPEYPKCE